MLDYFCFLLSGLPIFKSEKLIDILLLIMLKFSSILLASLFLIVIDKIVEARPEPDSLGICYLFEAEKLSKQERCVISTGYGAGAHYVVLNWSNGKNDVLYSINYCPEENYDSQGFCGYLVGEQEAIVYQRDVFYNRTNTNSEDNISCYQITDTNKSVCYRITS
ncbi:MAG: hypothetical protein AB4426_03200 [Xenococcaceae cyanobacterium]